LLLGATAVVAQQAGYATLQLTAPPDQQLRLRLDETLVHETPRAEIRVPELLPGRHSARITILGPSGEAASLRKEFYLEAGAIYEFKVRANQQGRYRVELYNLQTSGAADAASSNGTAGELGPAGQAGEASSAQQRKVDQPAVPGPSQATPLRSRQDTPRTARRIDTQATYITAEGKRARRPRSGGQQHEPSQRPPQAPAEQEQAPPQQRNDRRPPPHSEQHGPGPQPGAPPPDRYRGPIGCRRPVREQVVEQALAELRRLRNTATKIAEARQTIQRNCLLSVDIRALMMTLAYERDRFQLAKFAYDYVYDIENFHLVFEAFSGQHYPNELQRYLRMHRPAGRVPRRGRPPAQRPQPGPEPQPNPPPQQPAPGPMPGYEGPTGCPEPTLAPPEFQEAKQTIQHQSFSSSMMTTARQVIANNCLRTSQVEALMRLFSFESDKLALAKFAYPYTYDQGNYYRLNDTFSFESSIRELDEYLQSH
jgi:hypothetical protein